MNFSLMFRVMVVAAKSFAIVPVAARLPLAASITTLWRTDWGFVNSIVTLPSFAVTSSVV